MESRRKPIAAASPTDEMNTKRLKKSKPDLISDLPDHILHHILSFLDIIYAIPTSLLSRRWRSVWNSLPFLNISDEVYNNWKLTVETLGDDLYETYEEEPEEKKNHFTDFVNLVLMMRDRRSDVSSCRFSFIDRESDIDQKKIFADMYVWILVLIRSNVEVIDLRNCHLIEQLNLPPSLFNCKSLTTLKLDMELDFDDAELPKFNLPTKLPMNLPALRVLELRFLSIVGDVGKLISSCPVLETFIISKCVVNLSGKQLNISASHLKKLVIEEINDDSSEAESYIAYCKLKVFAPKLTSFVSRGSPINDYSFVEVSSLENAELETDENAWSYYSCDDGEETDWRITWKQEYFKHLSKCFKGIYNVRSLTLSAWLLTIITEARVDYRSFPVGLFCNLRLLNLKTSLSRREMHGITCLLEKAPNLETIVLKMVEYELSMKPVSREDYIWEEKLELQCMMDHLKLVEIWDILTSVNELEFLKFLLKNATILEKMIVHTPKEKPASDNIKLKRFGENLKKFPAASSMAQISFLSYAKPREPDADLPIGH